MKAGKKREKYLYAGGYLTVFLALTITVLLSLILLLLEGARINAIRMKTETAGNIAVRSALGEFHRELLRQYDLYFIDTSYGTGAGGTENGFLLRFSRTQTPGRDFWRTDPSGKKKGRRRGRNSAKE